MEPETDSRATASTLGSAPLAFAERYELLGEHGRGGLGRVSRARDVHLGREVAIKELLARSPISERRFVREALITARLEHPGIVPVHEAGRWSDGTPFYAMKLVAGRPLRALIAERSTVEARIALLHHVIAVADAMAYAHDRHIIHRDLKPANVIVGEFGETVVIDWGLAKDLAVQDDPHGGAPREPSDPAATQSLLTDLTTAGSVLGTPAYMPPEQERGERVAPTAWRRSRTHRLAGRQRFTWRCSRLALSSVWSGYPMEAHCLPSDTRPRSRGTWTIAGPASWRSTSPSTG